MYFPAPKGRLFYLDAAAAIAAAAAAAVPIPVAVAVTVAIPVTVTVTVTVIGVQEDPLTGGAEHLLRLADVPSQPPQILV